MSSLDPAAGWRSASFHGEAPDRPAPIHGPQSHQELSRRPEINEAVRKRLTKLLLNVTIERSLGPVHVVMPPENTVADLVRAVVEAYVKEGRRPLLPRTDPKAFDLHYSQYSLESTYSVLGSPSRSLALWFRLSISFLSHLLLPNFPVSENASKF